MGQYLAVVLLLVLGIVFASGSFITNKIMVKGRPNAAKVAPYECGIVPTTDPPERFGVFSVSEHDPFVHSFTEKPKDHGAWINGGFFVLEPECLDYIDGDDTVWEQDPMARLASEGNKVIYVSGEESLVARVA